MDEKEQALKNGWEQGEWGKILKGKGSRDPPNSLSNIEQPF